MELSKVRTMEQIIASFKDGQTIAIGGQTNHYMPERLRGQASDGVFHRFQRPRHGHQPHH